MRRARATVGGSIRSAVEDERVHCGLFLAPRLDRSISVSTDWLSEAGKGREGQE